MAADRDLVRPWSLLPNRVSRFYRGGLLLDRFRGAPDAADSDRPEDWIGSATRAWAPPGADPTDEGLGDADIGGAPRRVLDLLASDPAAVAGPDLGALPRTTTGILVTLLDAAIRLPVHAHPSRSFARSHLGSTFGKAEAWIVLATRPIDGEPPPHVRLGFRHDVGRDELIGLIENERSGELLEAIHVRETAPGDVWFVPPGTPHAIGAGVFILEIQEPTDFSIVLETAGFPIDRADAHLGLGWDTAVETIDRRALGAAALDALRGTPGGRRLDREPGHERSLLTPDAASGFFRAERIIVHGRARPFHAARFTVGVVTAGRGAVSAGGDELAIGRGSTFALPAGAATAAELSSADGDSLEVIACLPAPAAEPTRAEEP
jgi:mannose-6-phosphate isomerase